MKSKQARLWSNEYEIVTVELYANLKDTIHGCLELLSLYLFVHLLFKFVFLLIVYAVVAVLPQRD
jgi:hypothetical protein